MNTPDDVVNDSDEPTGAPQSADADVQVTDGATLAMPPSAGAETPLDATAEDARDTEGAVGEKGDWPGLAADYPAWPYDKNEDAFAGPAQADDTGDLLPVPLGGEDIGPGARPVRSGVALVLGGLLVVTLALLGAALWNRQAAVAALSLAIERLPARLGDPARVTEYQPTLDLMLQDARAGRFGTLRERLNALSASASQAPPILPLTAEPESETLPPEAQAFFSGQPELAARFMQYVGLSRQLKDRGVDVQPLRDVRDAVVTAARLGSAAAVGQELDRYAELLAGMGMPPPPPGPGAGPSPLGAMPPGAAVPPAGPGGMGQGIPPQLQVRLQEVQRVAAEAQQAGRDPSAAMKTFRDLQTALAARDYVKASRLADQVIRKLQNAPVAASAPPAPLPPAGGSEAIAEQLASRLAGMASAEDKDLAVIQDALDTARSALSSGSQEQANAALERALKRLNAIDERRQEYRGGPPPAGTRAGSGTAAPGPGAVPQRSQAEIMDLLSSARRMSDAEFERRKSELARELAGSGGASGGPAPANSEFRLPNEASRTP